MKIKSIKRIEPEMSNCITVDSPDKLFAVGENSRLLTHNSVAQQNIIISCLLRPEDWVLLGIDLKRVELTRFREFGVKVATDEDSAVQFLRFASSVMMKRYEKMEDLGVNDFRDMPEKQQALLVMVDELGELLSTSGVKTDEAKATDELKGEAKMLIGSIARLGRAAGVHLVLATQRPDADLIGGEVRDNLAVRIGCGSLKPSASTMMFDSNIGQQIHSNPPGGVYIQIHGQGNMGQGFFAPDTWLSEYFKQKGVEVKRPDLAINEVEAPKEAILGSKQVPHIDRWDNNMDRILSAGD